MSEGDKFRFFVPPELAYGEQGTPGGPIGPNEALIFEVELIEVQNPDRNLEAANAYLAENAKAEGVKTTASGLQYEIIAKAETEEPTVSDGDIVTVHYTGFFADGEEFVSSYTGGEPATLPLQQGMKGWIEGLQLMRTGDKFRFFIPPELAFGERGTPNGPIGPNEAVIYEMELVKVQNPERNLAAAEKFLAENSGKDGVTTTDSGLQYEVLERGADGGKNPSAQNTVKVHYKGTLLSGDEFDSSYSRGAPAEFPLNGVIAGWTEGVQLMNEGDKFRFFVPPALAYGERGTPGGPIGPNEALIFEVELLEVR